MSEIYQTKEHVLERAQIILRKSLRNIIPSDELKSIEDQVLTYQNKRKGFLGGLIEWYVFGKKADGLSQADFNIAGIELKTTPLKKHPKHTYAAKERLVFSMINYGEIIKENWINSSFLKKNKTLLLLFYLWVENQSILDYKFKFVYLLNLLEDISKEDIFQIQKDWEYIVAKISRGEAHLLSEGDTYYLGACTKAANSRVVRDQPMNRAPAKPRAFSLKQQYINYLIQTKLLGEKTGLDSIFAKSQKIETIEDAVRERFAPFINKTDKEILDNLNSNLGKKAKNYKRLIVNRIFGVNSKNIEELEKANITLRVVTLEYTGTLRESISFPAFDYKDLVSQIWSEEESMADFHLQLETKKFLFVVFQKQKNNQDIILRKTVFWNFPMQDINKAERVWQNAINSINNSEYDKLPKIKDSYVAHVRPHGKNAKDTIETPQKTQEIKRCFWLNAKYIQSALEGR